MGEKRSYFNLDETLRQAAGRYGEVDPEEAATKAGADYNQADRSLSLPFIGQVYRIAHPKGAVTLQNGEGASTYIAIILLHHLVTADGTPLTGRWISFRHLPGGNIYIEPFQKRAVEPFLSAFGNKPGDFKVAAAALGGREVRQSGTSMVVTVLPRVPICFTLWPGDEELPASANILFDEAAPHYLPTEDYAHLPGMVNGAMKKTF